MEGPLSKWTNVMNGWQYRWFVLDEGSGLLSYYTSKEKMMRGSRRGCVRLKGAVIGIDDEDESTFTIRCDQKIFHFQARDLEEREKWIGALEETILRHTQTQSIFDNGHPAPGFSAKTPFIPTIEDFDKRLSEADVYLQMLIDQTSSLDKKIASCESEGTLNAEDPAKYEELKTTTESMIESIKHTIVLLQIAKSYNADTLQKTEGDRDSRSSSASSKLPAVLPRASVSSVANAGVADVETAQDALAEGGAAATAAVEIPAAAPTSARQSISSDRSSPRVIVPNRAKQTPPPTSYSSSEDEEWEDAVDGEDEDDDEEWSTRRERKESAHSQHSQHLVSKSLPALPEDGAANPLNQVDPSRMDASRRQDRTGPAPLAEREVESPNGMIPCGINCTGVKRTTTWGT